MVNSAVAALGLQAKEMGGLHGVVDRFLARPLGGTSGAPARWVMIRDVADPAFLARNGTLFQYNKGARVVH